MKGAVVTCTEVEGILLYSLRKATKETAIIMTVCAKI
jgi:hypothetical protein